MADAEGMKSKRFRIARARAELRRAGRLRHCLALQTQATKGFELTEESVRAAIDEINKVSRRPFRMVYAEFGLNIIPPGRVRTLLKDATV